MAPRPARGHSSPGLDRRASGHGRCQAACQLLERRHRDRQNPLWRPANPDREQVPVGRYPAVPQRRYARPSPHQCRVHTITYDNGREFTDHEGMARDLETQIYFAHPYVSWERGLNESTNGLISQHFPKHRDLTTVIMLKSSVP